MDPQKKGRVQSRVRVKQSRMRELAWVSMRINVGLLGELVTKESTKLCQGINNLKI